MDNGINDPVSGRSITKRVLPGPAVKKHLFCGINNGDRVNAGNNICPHINGLRPFSGIADGHAWDIEDARFFLHTPGIREGEAGL